MDAASSKSYVEFKRALRLRESSDDYRCVNRLGYLGAYQFGMARLCDLGFTRRRDPKATLMCNDAFEFIPPLNRQKFLDLPRIQELCFDKHVRLLREWLRSHCPGDYDLSGAIGACHLLGPKGFEDYYYYGVDHCDAFGTKISEYYGKFSGYEIP